MIVTIKGHPINRINFHKLIHFSVMEEMTSPASREWCKDFEKNAPTDIIWGSTGQPGQGKPKLDAVRKYAKHAKDIVTKEIDIKNEELEGFIVAMEEIGITVITKRDENLDTLL